MQLKLPPDIPIWISRMPVVSNLIFRLFAFPQRVLHKTQGQSDSIIGNTARAYLYPLRKIRENQAPLALARMVPDSLTHPSVEPLRKCKAFAESFKGPSEIVWGDKDPIKRAFSGNRKLATVNPINMLQQHDSFAKYIK